MGCGDSKPTLSFDDFKPSGEDAETKVDKGSIKALWDKKYSKFELTDKELTELTPGEPITEKNEEDKFPDFKQKFLNLVGKKTRLDELQKNPMPYLKQYFPILGQKVKTYSLPPLFFELAAHGKDPTPYITKDMAAWFESTGKPLLQKSFDHHDADADGVLDADESVVFFKHLVEMQSAVVDDMIEPIMLEATMAMMKLHGYHLKATDPVLQKEVKAQSDPCREEITKNVRDYLSNKEEKDKAAFAVMDANGDGKLQVEEFLNIMMPLSDKNKEFFAALGFPEYLVAPKPAVVKIHEAELAGREEIT